MTDTRDRLVRCFSAVFSDLDRDEIPVATKETVAGWDSLANFSLLTVVEEEFGIQVPGDDIEEFASFDRLLRYLQRTEMVA
jgi:acyl carrier protein